jgi:hypothetical protein
MTETGWSLEAPIVPWFSALMHFESYQLSSAGAQQGSLPPFAKLTMPVKKGWNQFEVDEVRENSQFWNHDLRGLPSRDIKYYI